MYSLNKLVKAKENYDKEILNIENKLSDKIDFVFSVLYQQSDGFVVLNKGTAENTKLGDCLLIIKEKGILTYEDYKKYSI